ncbi:MAG: hypothetical protein WAV76_15220 [Bacteroidota bacterium]
MACELHEGQNVRVKLPYRELFSTTKPEEQNIFIAGGTRVTPFLSLFTDKQFAQYKSSILYFGARSNRYNVYKKEFKEAQSVNPAFRIHVQYEDAAGMLNIEHILQQHTLHDIFYIFGPPVMIKSFKDYLKSRNVSKSNIRTDEWE